MKGGFLLCGVRKKKKKNRGKRNSLESLEYAPVSQKLEQHGPLFCDVECQKDVLFHDFQCQVFIGDQIEKSINSDKEIQTDIDEKVPDEKHTRS